ncbi:MAG: ACR3 family arsenite efflux transporter [Candidatus Desulforudaceae bacterium]|jgi:ACR3 family arsenite transporter
MAKAVDSGEGQLEKARPLGFFQKYLTLWVLLSMAVGIGLGALFPRTAELLNAMSIAQVNIPIAFLLFGMMYPIMVQIDFSEVKLAARNPKPVLLTLFINWAIKPFTMLFFAWLFFRVIWAPFLTFDEASSYIAGLILLGIAPCTAMVLVWSYLAKGSMGHTLVMVAVNSLTMLFLYAPLGGFLLGASEVVAPFATLFLAILFYVGLALVAGYFTRTRLMKRKGAEWYETIFLKHTGKASMAALLATLIFLFMLQGDVILAQPLLIGMIAVPLIIQTLVIFTITYIAARLIGLYYEDAAPSALIGASNHFEVAIATAATLFGLASGAALATVVGVLIEVPLMLILVRVCLRTIPLFPRKIAATPEPRTTGLTPRPIQAFRRPGPSPAGNANRRPEYPDGEDK